MSLLKQAGATAFDADLNIIKKRKKDQVPLHNCVIKRTFFNIFYLTMGNFGNILYGLTLIQRRKTIFKRTRLIDISRETGFSVNTVSQALKQRGRFNAETRELILEAARHLHYVPNGSARSLVTNENKSVGVIVRNLRSPVLMEMIARIEDYLRSRGYCTIIMSAEGDLLKTVDSLLFQNVGGMLIYPELSMKHLDKFRYLRSMDFPFVLMSSDGNDYGLDTVFMDRRTGAHKATVHLAGLGHKKIGIISGDTMKLEGYKQALEEYRIAFDENLVSKSYTNNCQGGYDACAELLDRNSKMTALFCSTDTYALGAVKCCHDRSIKIPAGMAIVGYDNLDAAAFAEVPLTTIAYNIQTETEIAVELLFRRMQEGSGVMKNENIPLEPELIIRESSCPKPPETSKAINKSQNQNNNKQ